jgi:hypothetical protein
MIWVQCFLASEGDLYGRPYKNRCSVGATFMVALARTANGTQTKTEVKQ